MKILSVSQKNGIAVVQISTVPNNTLEMVTLAVALKNNLIEVKEVDESGRVNELLVLNNSDKLVFFMDGDVLDGAKQNRVLNTSVLLAPHTNTKIPVSCVESGRWGYKSRSFQSSDFVAPKSLRTNKASAVTSNLAKKNGSSIKSNGSLGFSITDFESPKGLFKNIKFIGYI